MSQVTQPADPPASACFAADVYDIDLTDGSNFRASVPHEAFDALRAAGGVTWHEEPSVPMPSSDGDLLTFVESPGFWSVTSHADVSTVLRNQDLFSSQLGGVFLPSLAPESLATFRQMMLNMDPPEHSRLRRILQPIFTPRAIERLRESVDLNAAGDRGEPRRPRGVRSRHGRVGRAPAAGAGRPPRHASRRTATSSSSGATGSSAWTRVSRPSARRRAWARSARS